MTCRTCGTDMLTVHTRPAPNTKDLHRRLAEKKCPACHRRAEVEIIERALKWLAPTRIDARTGEKTIC